MILGNILDRRWWMMEKSLIRYRAGGRSGSDRRMSINIKGKVYRTVVRLMLYGGQTLLAKEAHENKLDFAEMEMLQFVCGVTKLDGIRNERIRGTTKVWEILTKVQERRLRWYWHSARRISYTSPGCVKE